jgi:hypothetical protein
LWLIGRCLSLALTVARGQQYNASPLRFQAEWCALINEVRTMSHGQLVFGTAAALFGVLALIWHDPQTWQALEQLRELPFGTVIGGGLMIAQFAGGIGMLYARTARWASIVLAVVYFLFSFACVPGIIAAPGNFDSFFEQFAALCGAIAVYSKTERNRAQAAKFGRFARVGLGVCAISFTLTQIVYFRPTVSMVPKWIPPSQVFWAVATTIAFALAAIAILVRRQARLAMRLMTLMVALFGALVWIPRLIAHPEAHLSWSEFALTFLITGAAWTVGDLKSF